MAAAIGFRRRVRCCMLPPSPFVNTLADATLRHALPEASLTGATDNTLDDTRSKDSAPRAGQLRNTLPAVRHFRSTAETGARSTHRGSWWRNKTPRPRRTSGNSSAVVAHRRQQGDGDPIALPLDVE
jgi:hypothetical protein